MLVLEEQSNLKALDLVKKIRQGICKLIDSELWSSSHLVFFLSDPISVARGSEVL
jgi:hypothetical protein